MDKKIITFLIALLMFSSVFGLISMIPVASATPPASSISNTSYLNTSVSYWHNVAISNSGSTSLKIPVDENSSFSTYSFGSGSEWSLASNNEYATWTQTFSGAPNYVFITNANTIELDSVAFELGLLDVAGRVSQELGTIYANLTLNGNEQVWQHTFNFDSLSNSYYAIFTPTWDFSNGAPLTLDFYSNAATASLSLVATVDGTAYTGAPSDLFTTTVDQGQNVIVSSISTSPDSVPWDQGYHYGTVSSTFTPTSDLTSFDVSWSGAISETQPTYDSSTQTGSSGSFTGVVQTGPQSISFGVSGDPSVSNTNPLYVTASYDLSSQVQAQSTTTTQSYNSGQNPTENQNWWNSSSSYTLTPPSTALSNPSLTTTSGSINAETTMTWDINHIISAGYQYSPPYDVIYYSGNDISSSSFVPSSQYNSISQSSSTVIDSSTALSYSFDELINYNPSTPTLSTSFSNTGSQANLNIKTGEQISGERENIQINWGDGTITSLTNVSSGTQSTQSHSYSGTYQGTFSQSETIIVTVTNLPNGNPSGNDQLSTSNSTVYTFGMVDNPTTPNSILKVGQSVYMNLTTTNLTISGATVSVNGLSPSSATLVHQKGSVYDFKFSSSLFGVSGVTVTWSIDPAGITDIFSTQYATPIEPTTNSSYITALFSNTATHSYPISLSGVPNGTGYYQQLLTISNPSSYGINTAGSNIQFTASNGTLLYAWIQSINSTSMQVWVKNYYGNSVIDMQVLPSFENDFSATGYLGTNPLISSTTNNWAEMIKGLSLNSVKANPNDFVGYGSGATGWENVSGVLRQTLLSNANDAGNGAVAVLQNQGAFYNNRSYSLTMTFNYTGATNPRIGSVSNMYPYGSNGSAYTARTGYRFIMTGASNSGQAVSFLNDHVDWVDTGDYTTSAGTDYTLVVTNNNGSYSYSLYAGSGTSGTLLYSASGISYSVNNRQGQNFGFLGISDSAFSSTYSTGGGSLPMNVTSMSISILGAPPIMPTFTIGTGSVFQANATADNTTSQHYATFGPDAVNLTDGEYTYSIPDSFNSNYITIYYNPAWTIDYASYGFAPGVQATSSGTMPYITFAGVSGIGTLTMTFTEPLVIGQPLGTMSLGVLPSVAVGGNAFFELPNDLLHWTANGVPINPSGFSVVVGKPVLIQAFSAGDTSVFNETFTPTKEVTFLQTYVNITAFQFNNLNSTDEVQISATNSQNVTQTIGILGGYGTMASSLTEYLPSGSYTFRYTQLNYTTGQVVAGTSTATAPLAEYNGEYWVTLSGFTIFQLGNQLKYTNSSIQKSIQSLSVIISLNDSQIKNLTLGVDLNLTATNSSIQNVLQRILVSTNFINDTILNVNDSLQARFTTTNSIINDFQNNITVLDTYTNDTVNTIKGIITNVNTNLSTANSVIDEIKTIDSTNFTALNSTVKSNYLKLISSENFINSTILAANNNITLFYKYQNDLINSTTDNIEATQIFTNDTVNYIKSLEAKLNQNITLANATINEVKFIASQNFTALNSTVKSNYLKLISSENFVNSTILAENNNITLFYKYQNDLINTTTSNIEITQTFTNDTVNYIKSLETKLNQNLTLANATIGEVKFIAQQNFTALNSTVVNNFAEILDNQKFVNSTLIAENNNVTLFWKYESDLINKTESNVKVVQSVVNSTSKEIETNLTFDYLTLDSMIGNNSLYVNQSILFSKNTVATDNLIYKTTLAMEDYVDSRGTGVVQTSDGTTVPAYSNILDPFEVNQVTTESNLSTNKTTIWFGNPINSSFTDVVVSDSPNFEFFFNGVYNNTIVVTYYNTTLGLQKVSSTSYTESATYTTIPINKQYISDGYSVEITLNYTGTKATNVSIQSEIQWTGQIGFVWDYSNSTKLYSTDITVPGDAGYFGTVNLATLHGVFMNTTYQIQTVSVGFPSGITASISSIVVKDLTNGFTLTQGSNYAAYTNGVSFTQNNWYPVKYYISFTQQIVSVNNQNINVPMTSIGNSVLDGATYLVSTGTYVNQQNQQISGNLYMSLPNAPLSSNLIVVINNQTVNSADVTVSGTQVIVSGYTVGPNEQITVTVYYTSASPLSGFNFLFKSLIPGTILNFWVIILLVSMIVLVFPLHALKYIRGRTKRNYKMTVIFGMYSLFALAWVLLLLFYLAGLL